MIEVRRKHSLDTNLMMTLLGKQGKDIKEQDTILARLEDVNSELYDSDHAVTIRRSTTSNGMECGRTAEENGKLKRSGNIPS